MDPLTSFFTLANVYDPQKAAAVQEQGADRETNRLARQVQQTQLNDWLRDKEVQKMVMAGMAAPGSVAPGSTDQPVNQLAPPAAASNLLVPKPAAVQGGVGAGAPMPSSPRAAEPSLPPQQHGMLQRQLAIYQQMKADGKIEDYEYGKLVTDAITSSNAKAAADLEQFGKLAEMVKKGGGPAKFGALVTSGMFDGIAPPETLAKLKQIDYSKMKEEPDFTEYELPSGGRLVSGRDADGKPYTHVMPADKSLSAEQLTAKSLEEKLGRKPTATEIKAEMDSGKSKTPYQQAEAVVEEGLKAKGINRKPTAKEIEAQILKHDKEVAKAGAAGRAEGKPDGGEGLGVGAPGLGVEALEGLNPSDAAIVKKIANYQIPLPTAAGLRSPYWQRILGRVAAYDSTFDASQYNVRLKLRNDFTSGKSAANIRSLNTAVGHLGSMEKSGKALGNRSVQWWNYLTNKTMSTMGDSAVDRFLTSANAVESELAAVFKGTGATDQEIKSWRARINETKSPKQLKAIVKEAVELLSSRLDALAYQYAMGMGKPKDFRILNPKSVQVLKGLGVDVDKIDPLAQRGEVDTPSGGSSRAPQPDARISTASRRISSDMRGNWSDAGRQQQVYNNLKKNGYSDIEIGRAFQQAKGGQ